MTRSHVWWVPLKPCSSTIVSAIATILPAENDIHLLLRAFVDELVRCGITDACTSPGSRSTPLVLALVRDGRLRCTSHIDERSGAFFGLGLAQATRRLVALARVPRGVGRDGRRRSPGPGAPQLAAARAPRRAGRAARQAAPRPPGRRAVAGAAGDRARVEHRRPASRARRRAAARRRVRPRGARPAARRRDRRVRGTPARAAPRRPALRRAARPGGDP